MNRHASLLSHGLVGWAICGATIGIGRQVMSMQATLLVHAAVAPLAFGLLTWRHVRRHPESTPGATALAMTGLVIALDALAVAPVFEHSYVMFRSVLGTWIPFASIAVASYAVARTAAARSRPGAPAAIAGQPGTR